MFFAQIFAGCEDQWGGRQGLREEGIVSRFWLKQVRPQCYPVASPMVASHPLGVKMRLKDQKPEAEVALLLADHRVNFL